MAIRRQKAGPSDETIERVRFIVSFRATHAPSKSQPVAAEQDPLSAEFYSEFISTLDGLGLAVLFHKGKGLFDKEEKLRYRVTEHKVIRLEFADRLTVGVVDGPRELVSVGRYTPGNWEERLKQAYDECLRLSVLLDEVAATEDRLTHSETPEDVVALLDSMSDPEGMLRMLCMSTKRSSNAYTLYMSHILADRIKEAHHIIETAVELNPADARLHLMQRSHRFRESDLAQFGERRSYFRLEHDKKGDEAQRFDVGHDPAQAVETEGIGQNGDAEQEKDGEKHLDRSCTLEPFDERIDDEGHDDDVHHVVQRDGDEAQFEERHGSFP